MLRQVWTSQRRSWLCGSRHFGSSALLHSATGADTSAPANAAEDGISNTLSKIALRPQRTRLRVALVGRTNVGKSTLYNRLTKSRAAIVHNVPGTTRDRRYALGRLAGMEFDVIDTGGLEDAPTGTLEEGMLRQTLNAVHEADVVFFMIDGRQGVTAIDSHFGRWLRKQNPAAPIHVIANKVEGYPDRWQDALNDCYQLGMGSAIPLSAEHGDGLTHLIDILMPLYDQKEKEYQELLQEFEKEHPDATKEDSQSLKLAIVGRPNVGKSTLLNKIVRKDRVLTGPEPGVTRDAVEVPWRFRGQEIKLVDTAGIRKHSKRDLTNQIENLSVRDSFRAIESAQVVIVVVDTSESKMIHLDKTIAQRVIEEGRGLIIAANKSDLCANVEAEMDRLRNELDDSLAQVRGVPVVPISALSGKGIRKLLPAVMNAYERWDLRVSTGKLNRWLAAMARHHPPPTAKGKQLKVKYMTQVKSRPPTFALFVNNPTAVPESYQRFLMNQLREEFDMLGVPARLLLRGNKENPFQKSARGKSSKPKRVASVGIQNKHGKQSSKRRSDK